MQRVTALGDAIHVMPPTGGQGANTALRDAACLVEAIKSRGATLEGIRTFETKMREYALAAVKGSSRGGKWMFDQKSFEECKTVRF
jgi:2-polyprenyl-6-methoxyphenol hydroxylase-like FAD-dependent oxidoreductase